MYSDLEYLFFVLHVGFVCSNSISMVLNVKTFSFLLCINKRMNRKNVIHFGHCTHSLCLSVCPSLHLPLSYIAYFQCLVSMNFKRNNKNKFTIVGELVSIYLLKLFRLFCSRHRCRFILYLFNTFSNGGDRWQRYTTSHRHESLLFRHIFAQFG